MPSSVSLCVIVHASEGLSIPLEVDNSVTSAPAIHSHRRGGKKREAARGPVNDCAYDGKEEPLGMCLLLKHWFQD
jgi:hypothetical protein